MRLPSQPQDPRDLLRNISMASDGPEEMIMADEYVNNASNRRRLITQLDRVRKSTSNKMLKRSGFQLIRNTWKYINRVAF